VFETDHLSLYITCSSPSVIPFSFKPATEKKIRPCEAATGGRSGSLKQFDLSNVLPLPIRLMFL
jgi:hypothetical protein